MKKILFYVIFIIFTFSLSAKSYYAQDYNCQINVRTNGDLQIREVFRYYFSGEPYTWVNRIIPEHKTDGIEFIRALVKDTSGEIISRDSDYQYDNGAMVVKWKFEPTVEKALDFELEFIARHVCYFENDMIVVDWQPLPRDHEFIIDQGEIEIIFPRSIPEDILIYPTESKNVSVKLLNNAIRYNFHSLAGDETFPIGITLQANTLPIEQPNWQIVKQRQSYNGKYLLWLLGFIILLAIVLAFRLIGVSQSLARKFTPEVLPADLYDLHPGCVSKLINNFENSSTPFASLFFRLLKMGYVEIDEIKKGKYNIRLTSSIPEHQIDKSFYEILQIQLEKGKNDLRKLFSSLFHYRKNINEQIMTWLFENGYADEKEYKRYKKNLNYLLLFIFLAIIAFFAGIIRFSFGYSIILFCSVPLICLVIFLIYKTSMIHIHTEEGFRERYTWKLWKKAMIYKMKKDPQSLKSEEFDILFPYALVMGFADGYIKHFKKAGIDLSDSKLMQSFESSDALISFVAAFVAIANSTGSSGSSAGVGAGGGSASAG